MPLSPQITITPEDIVFKSFDISAVTYTSSTATYTATGHTFSAGNVVQITGLAPDGYNGTYTISSVATNTFTVANTTNTALTDQTGNAYWADPTEYEYTGGQTVAYLPNDNDVNSIVDTNATVAAAAAQAAAAASAASTAQSTANTALANAATAYTTAQNSLQPSAYAIQNPTTKQLTAIDATGLTVWSGGSSTSGARVVLNSTGLAGFNSSGVATFSVSATTGDAIFKGNIAGASIIGSDLNISGNCIIKPDGTLIAMAATVKGTINADAGYFGSSTNGFSINSTGMIGVGGGVISGGIITTSTGSTSVSLVGSNNSLTFKTSGTNVGHILPLSSFGVLTHYGATADPSGGTFPQMFVGSTGVSLFASTTIGIGVNTSIGINLTASTGGINLNSQTNYTGIATGSGSTMVVVTTGSRIAYTTSSERFKQEITYIDTPGWLDKVMAMKPITYKTSDDFTVEGEPNETQYGFLAEDIYDLGGGLEKSVVLDPLGDPFSLSYDRLTVFLTLAIKELKAEIDELKAK